VDESVVQGKTERHFGGGSDGIILLDSHVFNVFPARPSDSGIKWRC